MENIHFIEPLTKKAVVEILGEMPGCRVLGEAVASAQMISVRMSAAAERKGRSVQSAMLNTLVSELDGKARGLYDRAQIPIAEFERHCRSVWLLSPGEVPDEDDDTSIARYNYLLLKHEAETRAHNLEEASRNILAIVNSLYEAVGQKPHIIPNPNWRFLHGEITPKPDPLPPTEDELKRFVSDYYPGLYGYTFGS